MVRNDPAPRRPIRIRDSTLEAGAAVRKLRAVMGRPTTMDRSIADLYRRELRRLVKLARKRGIDVGPILDGLDVGKRKRPAGAEKLNDPPLPRAD